MWDLLSVKNIKITQYNIIVHTHKIYKWDITYIHLRLITSIYQLKIFDYIFQNTSAIIKQAYD